MKNIITDLKRDMLTFGYVLISVEFETTLFNELEMEILFCRDGVIKQREIPLESIWDLSGI